MLDRVAAHARDALPAECCGVLIGTSSAILEAVRAGNLAGDPSRRFLIDPRDHIAAVRAARHRGLAVVGFYHSHPRSEARPSPADLEAASYPDHLYLIVGPLTDGYQARLFRLEGPRFVEVDLAG